MPTEIEPNLLFDNSDEQLIKAYQLPEVPLRNLGTNFFGLVHLDPQNLPPNADLLSQAFLLHESVGRLQPREVDILYILSNAYLRAVRRYPSLDISISGALLKKTTFPEDLLGTRSCFQGVGSRLTGEVWHEMSPDQIAFVLCPRQVYAQRNTDEYTAAKQYQAIFDFAIRLKEELAGSLRRKYGEGYEEIQLRSAAEMKWERRKATTAPELAVFDFEAYDTAQKQRAAAARTARAEASAAEAILSTGNIGQQERRSFIQEYQENVNKALALLKTFIGSEDAPAGFEEILEYIENSRRIDPAVIIPMIHLKRFLFELGLRMELTEADPDFVSNDYMASIKLLREWLASEAQHPDAEQVLRVTGTQAISMDQYTSLSGQRLEFVQTLGITNLHMNLVHFYQFLRVDTSRTQQELLLSFMEYIYDKENIFAFYQDIVPIHAYIESILNRYEAGQLDSEEKLDIYATRALITLSEACRMLKEYQRAAGIECSWQG